MAATFVAVASSLFAGEERPVEFRVGFGRVDITPEAGTFIPGSYGRRVVDGVLDPLEASAVVFDDNNSRVAILAVDNLHIQGDVIKLARTEIERTTGIKPLGIYIHSSHTHLGGETLRRQMKGLGMRAEDMPAITNYVNKLVRALGEAAKAAVEDLAPATIAVGRTELKGHAFIRSFLMKDGRTRTNPGVGNKDIARPIGTADETLQLVRLIRKKPKKEIDLVNFQNHPDTIGGTKVSADWVGFARRATERILPSVRCVVFNGAEGDLNHVNVNPRPGEVITDNYRNARNLGVMVAGAVLTIWGRCDPEPVGRLHCASEPIKVPNHRPTPDELELARKYHAAHIAGRREEIPFTGMDYVTAVADAGRKISCASKPDFHTMWIHTVTVAHSLAFAGYPGEPFCDIGRRVRAGSPFAMTFVTCLTDGTVGYFPTDEAYEHGGYEAKSSEFGPGTADALVNGQVNILKKMYGWRAW